MSRSTSIILLALVLLLASRAADAALTTDKCLVKKRQAWSTLRKCQATEDVKRLKGKPTDLPKCQTKFQEKLAKITTQATTAAIACRYGDNGDGTVTDYDSGLMWEKKTGMVGGLCLFVPNGFDHCVNDTFDWFEAQTYVGGTSVDDFANFLPFLAGHSDWRLPTIAELRGILDTSVPACGPGSACIDPIFGPTAASNYWSFTTRSPDSAWVVHFDTGLAFTVKSSSRLVRAVRAGL